ncbi:Receptor-type guanylate cyclase gcy [Seminavis robusta]|uniref:Receptor-type guanylate cyclase gcy n=1 Tax=Seminavis robusta TaxID=568900 RepID=A0A9N8DBY6_9STRA|nr:Receptor-type guanylate cyclase gcy [Seminavis robusta]|eukprot:Sro23_g016190.1 Receptor-type guanylate cyclase gcy (734) ;mRNA; f:175745-178300
MTLANADIEEQNPQQEVHFAGTNDDDVSCTGHDHDEDPYTSESIRNLMTKKENDRIKMFRLMVLGMLIMTAVVTIVAKVFLGQQENRNFETAYGQFARTLADAALEQQQSLRASCRSLANEITAYAQQTNQSWPYVNLPLFESYAKGFFDHSKAEFIGVQNLVKLNETDDFINWTTAHYKDWVSEAHTLHYGNTDLLNTDPARYNQYISQKGPNNTYPPDKDRPYYAVRIMQSPPMRAYGPTLNLNLATIPGIQAIHDSLLQLKYETLVTRIKPFNAVPAEEHQNFHTDSEADNPHSFMFTPIWHEVQNPDSGIVGTLSSSVAWDASMQDLLPEMVTGILGVVRNDCGQEFTYLVSGKEAFYLGPKDHHDPKFDDLGVTVELGWHTHPNYTTTPGHCQYTLIIYPTDEFKDGYTTALPATFAIVVACTFSLVAIVFFIYDSIVQRRNLELAQDAARSDKLVSSLFPGEIKDILLAQQDVGDIKGRKGAVPGFSGSSGFMNQPDLTSTQLAKAYPHTTVFFGDLAGFTAWSSTRKPEQVFELLETLYSAFDSIAKKKRVFKIETIGDCYVAVCGLPNPQEDHATRMVRFADDCMSKMKILTTELSETLGADTSNLQLRVGLHTGGVTGGVLRGDKSRFQLYGDTVNTAARMETNGVPGRIHVSHVTADELLSMGKKNWLTPREDKIAVKGKGEMDTYFVAIPENGAASIVLSLTDTESHDDTGVQPLDVSALSV